LRSRCWSKIEIMFWLPESCVDKKDQAEVFKANGMRTGIHPC